MFIKYIRLFIVMLPCLAISCSTLRETSVPVNETSPKREFRGAWI